MAAAVHNYYGLEAQFDAHIICAGAVSVDTKKELVHGSCSIKKETAYWR